MFISFIPSRPFPIQQTVTPEPPPRRAFDAGRKARTVENPGSLMRLFPRDRTSYCDPRKKTTVSEGRKSARTPSFPTTRHSPRCRPIAMPAEIHPTPGGKQVVALGTPCGGLPVSRPDKGGALRELPSRRAIAQDVRVHDLACGLRPSDNCQSFCRASLLR
jgi:hypothetical protein